MLSRVEVMMATDRRFLWGCAVAGRTLIDSCSDPGAVHLHILQPDLTPEDKRQLTQSWTAAPGAGSVTFHPFTLERVRHLVRSKHVSHMAYARLFLAEFLPETVERAVYVDTDIVFNRDVLRLSEWPLGNAVLGAVPNGGAEESAEHFRRLGVSGSTYFNSGVLVCDVGAWRRERVSERALQFASTFRGQLSLWDQDLLNAVLVGAWCELPSAWNCWASRADRAHDIVLHYTMSPKPWHADYEGRHREQFFAALDRTAYAGKRAPSLFGLGPHLARLRRRIPYLPTAVRYGKEAVSRFLALS
jgi:lipopolysaccharide biosynthesis glycosyltransferase